jgi:hypothetical protein
MNVVMCRFRWQATTAAPVLLRCSLKKRLFEAMPEQAKSEVVVVVVSPDYHH